jgi:hypothetical protein
LQDPPCGARVRLTCGLKDLYYSNAKSYFAPLNEMFRSVPKSS